MSNIRGLGDIKKNEPGQGRGRGMPQQNDQTQGQGLGFGGFPGLASLLGFGGNGGSGGQQQSTWDHKVIVDFSAKWCQPCKYIGPIFAELSAQYTNMVFLNVDVDELQETAMEHNIKSMPTFIVFKNKKAVETLKGADESALRNLVEKHSKSAVSSTTTTASTGGYTLGGGDPNKPKDHPLLSKVGSNPTSNPTTSFNTIPSTSSGQSAKTDVNPVLLQAMVEMGFDEPHARSALVATKNANIDAAIEWCATHPAPSPSEGHQLTTTTATTTTTEPTPSTTSATTTTTTTTNPVPSEQTKPMDVDAKPEPQTPLIPHEHNALCNVCMEKIIGIRYKCKDCEDFDMCGKCYEMRLVKHDPDHDFNAYATELEVAEKERKPLTKEELMEKKRQLQERIVKMREEKQKQEAQAEIEREKVRRQSAKDAQAAKSQWEDKQRERDAAIRKREMEEEKRAKEAIRKKLEQDKLERESKKKESQAATQSTTTTTTPMATTTTTTTKKEYTESLIQLRLPDGNVIKATFKPSDPLRTVHNHVALLLGSSHYNLVSNFPKKVWSYKDSALDTTTLQQADCVPTGTFVVQKS